MAHAHPIRDPRLPAWAPAPALGPLLLARRRPTWLGLALVVIAVITVASIAAGVLLHGGLRLAASAADEPSPSPALAALVTAAPATAAPSPSVAPSPTAGPASPGPTGLAGYRWPLDHGRITAAFGPLNGGVVVVDGVPWHDGIDIASFCGDRIVAAHDGVVLAAGRHVDKYVGWIGDIDAYHARLDAKGLWGARPVDVIIDDGNGYRSMYVHLYRAAVAVGQEVKAGDFIGWEGQTGYATGCHLHYSVFDPNDPAMFQTLPRLVERELLPAGEIARIDPLTVLPPMSTTAVTWGWGVEPSPSPAP